MKDEPTRRLEPLGGTPAEVQAGSLYEAMWTLTSELSLDAVLQKVADLSRELVGASYSAMGVLGGRPGARVAAG